VYISDLVVTGERAPHPPSLEKSQNPVGKMSGCLGEHVEDVIICDSVCLGVVLTSVSKKRRLMLL
jgi:hypothetical protein